MKMYDKFYSISDLFYGCLVLLLCIHLPASAQSYSMTELTELAKSWLQNEISTQTTRSTVQVQPADQRLLARNCQSPLHFSLVNKQIQRQNTVKIYCSDAESWQIFIPARVSQMVTAVTTIQQLPAGSYLTAEMLRLADTEVLQSRGALFTNPELLVGARLKKSLNIGQFLTQNDLCLVCKGDVVTITGVSVGLSVTSKAKALQDGTLGESIRVQNLQSNRVITAEVTAVKHVEIKL